MLFPYLVMEATRHLPEMAIDALSLINSGKLHKIPSREYRSLQAGYDLEVEDYFVPAFHACASQGYSEMEDAK